MGWDNRHATQRRTIGDATIPAGLHHRGRPIHHPHGVLAPRRHVPPRRLRTRAPEPRPGADDRTRYQPDVASTRWDAVSDLRLGPVRATAALQNPRPYRDLRAMLETVRSALLILIVVTPALLAGQANTTSPEALAKALQDRYRSVRDFSGEFTQTYRGAALRTRTVESGKV